MADHFLGSRHLSRKEAGEVGEQLLQVLFRVSSEALEAGLKGPLHPGPTKFFREGWWGGAWCRLKT